MLWLEHVMIGFLLAWIYRKRQVGVMILGSIGPDLFMLPLVIKTGMFIEEWEGLSGSYLANFVFLPHSIFSLLLVPENMRIYWFSHIVADIISHKGEWAIRPFYPVSHWSYEGFYEPWVYLCAVKNV